MRDVVRISILEAEVILLEEVQVEENLLQQLLPGCFFL